MAHPENSAIPWPPGAPLPMLQKGWRIKRRDKSSILYLNEQIMTVVEAGPNARLLPLWGQDLLTLC
jgi:hypothetical protein